MDEVDRVPQIPHFEVRTLMEVGAVVCLFGLALGFMACSLNGTRGCEGFCSRLTLWNCWRKLRRIGNGNDDDDDEDGESYIDDAESGLRPAPHVFESLNELVFFEAPNEEFDNEGMLSTNGEESAGLLIPTSMEKIFPDLLAPEGSPEANDLSEPLL